MTFLDVYMFWLEMLGLWMERSEMGLILLDSSFLTHCAAFSFADFLFLVPTWELILVYFITFIHDN